MVSNLQWLEVTVCSSTPVGEDGVIWMETNVKSRQHVSRMLLTQCLIIKAKLNCRAVLQLQ